MEIKHRVIIISATGEEIEFSGPRHHQLRKARLHIKHAGGDWTITVSTYRGNELIDFKKLKR